MGSSPNLGDSHTSIHFLIILHTIFVCYTHCSAYTCFTRRNRRQKWMIKWVWHRYPPPRFPRGLQTTYMKCPEPQQAPRRGLLLIPLLPTTTLRPGRPIISARRPRTENITVLSPSYHNHPNVQSRECNRVSL